MNETPATAPLPITDPDAAGYYAALREHRLVLKTCDDCGQPHFYPRELCPHCFSDRLQWKPASGRGEIYSFTVARRPAGPAFKPQVPYVVALVQLDEGPRMMSNVITDRPEEVRIGQRVAIRYDDVTPEMTLPRFVLA